MYIGFSEFPVFQEINQTFTDGNRDVSVCG